MLARSLLALAPFALFVAANPFAFPQDLSIPSACTSGCTTLLQGVAGCSTTDTSCICTAIGAGKSDACTSCLQSNGATSGQVYQAITQALQGCQYLSSVGFSGTDSSSGSSTSSSAVSFQTSPSTTSTTASAPTTTTTTSAPASTTTAPSTAPAATTTSAAPGGGAAQLAVSGLAVAGLFFGVFIAA